MEEREAKIRSITQLYYSRPDIQKAIFDFSKNREISPRYYEGFGKRPDSFQYKGDVFSLVKKGATSFHCSEELWSDPMKIVTGMSRKDSDEIRIGWDLLIDIDCDQGIEFSKYAAISIVKTFEQHGIKNMGVKFSGSKGFHILLPWKSIPKNINGIETCNLFPEFPRKLAAYIRNYSEKVMRDDLPKDFENRLKNKLKQGYKCKKCGEFAANFLKVEFSCKSCNIFEEKIFRDGKGVRPNCYKCKRPMEFKPITPFRVCEKCEINSLNEPENFTQAPVNNLYDLMGIDIVLVSPRHLFRMPYSLHEKTSLVSVVIDKDKIMKFDKVKDADPLRAKVKNFMPDCEENEAAELVMQAFDWAKESGFDKEIDKKVNGKYADFKPVKLGKINDSQFPPCIKKILEGVKDDGRKRALFAILNLFRSIGMERVDLEKRIYEWNEKNEIPLKKGYINSQLIWSYRRKPIMPPNCKSFYQNIGVCSPDKLCSKIKNPVNYVMRKNFIENNSSKNSINNSKSNSKKN